MADIRRRCGHCGHTMTVSEYADMAALRCPSCGQAGVEAMPERETTVSSSGLRVKTPPPEPTPVLPPDAPAYEMPTFVQADRVTLWLGPMRWRALLPLAHWVLFIFLMFLFGIVVRMRIDTIARWALYGR